MTERPRAQLDKFKEAAREIKTGGDETPLGWMAGAVPPEDGARDVMAASEWDSASLNRRFKAAAMRAYEYLKQCRSLVAAQPAYEALIDEHTAIWEANDYFTDRTFLATKDLMLKELARIRDRDHKPMGIYDLERYRRHWRAEVDTIARSLSEEG